MSGKLGRSIACGLSKATAFAGCVRERDARRQKRRGAPACRPHNRGTATRNEKGCGRAAGDLDVDES